MSGQPEEFQDPELKAAIARLRGGHKVRLDLRETVLRRLEEQRREAAASAGATSGGNGEAVARDVDTTEVSVADLGAAEMSGLGSGEAATVEAGSDVIAERAAMRLAGDAADLNRATE